MRLLVTGASGLLGRAVVHAAEQAGHEVTGIAFSRANDRLARVDLTDAAAVEALVAQVRPDAVIHTAAERRPDVMEKEPDAAQALNVEVPATLGRICGDLSPPAYLVSLSTDYVFDGRNPPYATDAEPNPLNAYGCSKRDAETAVADAPGPTTSVRVPVLYGETTYDAESAVNVLLGNLLSDAPRTVDAHSIRYPTNVADVARALVALCELQRGKEVPKLLHFSAEEAMSKFDMCLVMARAWNRACGEQVVSADHLEPEYEADPNASTQRPGRCKLDTSATTALGIDVSCVEFEAWWEDYFRRRGPPKSEEEEENEKEDQDGHDEGDEAQGVQATAADAPNGSEPAADAQAKDQDVPSGAVAALNVTEPEAVSDAKNAKTVDAPATAKDAPDAPGAPEPAKDTLDTSNLDSDPNDASDAPPPPPKDAASLEATSPDDDEARYGTPSPTDTPAPPEPAASFTVRVCNPQRVSDRVSSHVVYTVRVTSDAKWIEKSELSALRRYSEFRWLHAAMVHNHPGVIVPSIPEKVKLNNMAPELVEFRRRALEQALHKMLHHPLLQKDEDLLMFLQSPNLAADIKARDQVKGAVITPEQKTYLGWSQSLSTSRFRETDEWFNQQQEYLSQLEARLASVVGAIQTLAQSRQELAAAQEGQYKSLVALSGSTLSRGVSTCFGALAEMKKRAADASSALATHEAQVLGLVFHEYERLIGNVRKAFATRIDVWQAWQRADDDLNKLKARHRRSNAGHLDVQMHALSSAELLAAALHSRFEDVSQLCKAEMQRFEREKVADLRAALAEYVHTFQTVQQETMDELAHCEAIVKRHASRGKGKGEKGAESEAAGEGEAAKAPVGVPSHGPETEASNGSKAEAGSASETEPSNGAAAEASNPPEAEPSNASEPDASNAPQTEASNHAEPDVPATGKPAVPPAAEATADSTTVQSTA